MDSSPKTTPADTRRYAGELLGLELDGGWRVVERFDRGPDPTGSVFSDGYIVERARGDRGFLKAVDLSAAFDIADEARAMEAMLAAFNFERDLLIRCRDRRMDRVVLAIADGRVLVDPQNRYSIVPYIIFELADGDVRKYLDLSDRFDLRWALRALHQVAVGLHQLHRELIAHQDLKPSNVMMFRSGSDAKLGDLGRASTLERPGFYDEHAIPGATRYAPPEQLYGAPSEDWLTTRVAADVYQLGSMMAYIFTGVSMTALWVRELPEEQSPFSWRGSYAEILPYLREAFDRATAAVETQIPASVRKPVGEMIRRLCDPDSQLRGHPKARAVAHGNRFALDRFVTELDLLARRAEAELLTHRRY